MNEKAVTMQHLNKRRSGPFIAGLAVIGPHQTLSPVSTQY